MGKRERCPSADRTERLPFPSAYSLAEGSRVRLGLGEEMGLGTSKETESSDLRAGSVSWPELYHVNEKRLIKDLTQSQDTTENIWGVVRSCAPLTFSPLKHHTATPDWHLKGE